MSREEFEDTDEQYHNDEGIGLTRGKGDPDTYGYPGEKLWLRSHPNKEVDLPRMIEKLGNGTTEQTASGIPE